MVLAPPAKNTTENGRLSREEKKNVQENRFALSSFLHRSCIWKGLFLFFTHWVPIRSIRRHSCAHASVFFFNMDLTVTLSTSNKEKRLSVRKNRNAKQSFPERALKSFHNQKHTYLISPLVLVWRLSSVLVRIFTQPDLLMG